LERIATGVVTIQIDSTRAFDTEWNTTAQATGFVIDAKRGLILTNRHVVTSGPVDRASHFLEPGRGAAASHLPRPPSTTSASITTIPQNCIFIQPAELPLYPQGAVIGREIRVVGNDAGEQLSILAGHAGAAGPRGAGIRLRQVQRLQHLLFPGGLEHLGRFVRLAGDRYRRSAWWRSMRGGRHGRSL